MKSRDLDFPQALQASLTDTDEPWPFTGKGTVKGNRPSRFLLSPTWSLEAAELLFVA